MARVSFFLRSAALVCILMTVGLVHHRFQLNATVLEPTIAQRLAASSCLRSMKGELTVQTARAVHTSAGTCLRAQVLLFCVSMTVGPRRCKFSFRPALGSGWVATTRCTARHARPDTAPWCLIKDGVLLGSAASNGRIHILPAAKKQPWVG